MITKTYITSSLSSRMDTTLLKYLEKHKINYKIHTHEAVFTVEEANKSSHKMPDVFHTKNLFLKDENNKFFLVCMNAFKRLDLKIFKEKINAKKKITFG